jgi:hypothetical protein
MYLIVQELVSVNDSCHERRVRTTLISLSIHGKSGSFQAAIAVSQFLGVIIRPVRRARSESVLGAPMGHVWKFRVSEIKIHLN